MTPTLLTQWGQPARVTLSPLSPPALDAPSPLAPREPSPEGGFGVTAAQPRGGCRFPAGCDTLGTGTQHRAQRLRTGRGVALCGNPQTSMEPPGASVLPEIPLCSRLGLSTEPCTSPLGSAAVSGCSSPLGLRCHLPVLPPPCMGTVPTCPSSPGNRSHPAPSPGHRTSPIGATPTGILAAPLVILFISSLFFVCVFFWSFLCFFVFFC